MERPRAARCFPPELDRFIARAVSRSPTHFEERQGRKSQPSPVAPTHTVKMSDFPHRAQRVAQVLLDVVVAVDFEGDDDANDRAVTAALSQLEQLQLALDARIEPGSNAADVHDVLVGAISALHASVELLAESERESLHGAAARVREVLSAASHRSEAEAGMHEVTPHDQRSDRQPV